VFSQTGSYDFNTIKPIANPQSFVRDSSLQRCYRQIDSHPSLPVCSQHLAIISYTATRLRERVKLTAISHSDILVDGPSVNVGDQDLSVTHTVVIRIGASTMLVPMRNTHSYHGIGIGCHSATSTKSRIVVGDVSIIVDTSFNRSSMLNWSI
jgi:hypothetical protein